MPMLLEAIDTNAIISIGSLCVAAMGLAASILFFRASHTQNLSFKTVDIEREEIREIREYASQFLQAATERLGAEDDAQTLVAIHESKAFNPDTISPTGISKTEVQDRLFVYNDLRRKAFARQGVCYEKMRLILDSRDANRVALLNCMVSLMKVKELGKADNLEFSSLVIETISARRNLVVKRIGLKNA
jgi:hypothetical protein